MAAYSLLMGSSTNIGLANESANSSINLIFKIRFLGGSKPYAITDYNSKLALLLLGSLSHE